MFSMVSKSSKMALKCKKSFKRIRNIIISTIYVLRIGVDKSLICIIVYIFDKTYKSDGNINRSIIINIKYKKFKKKNELSHF